LVTIEEQFNFIEFKYDGKQKLNTNTKLLNMNKTINDLCKKLIITKLYVDKNKKMYSQILSFRNYVLACTEKKLMIQDINDSKNFRILFETMDGQCKITEVYEGLKTEKISTVILILNNYVMVEIDVNKQDFINENLITNFIFKGKSDPKNKYLKFEVGNSYNYSVFLSFDDSRNPKAIWKFNEKIICLNIRPKQLGFSLNNSTTQNCGNHIAISYDNNMLKVFHYETKALVSEYQSHYGNIISISYSDDGKLLAAGTESDNVFIIDAEFNQLLYCLEGHKNYITSIIFEQISLEQENLGYENSYEVTKTDFIALTKASTLVAKEVSLDDFSKLILSDDNSTDVDIKKLRRGRQTARNSIVGSKDIEEEEEFKDWSIYDVYTSSLDGHIGVWRIEHFTNCEDINQKNYFSYPLNKDSSQIIKIDKPATCYLIPHIDIKVYNTSMSKFQNSPINKLFKFNNVFVYLAKRTNTGSSVYLRFYLGVPKEIDSDEAKKRIRSGRGGTSASQSPAKRSKKSIAHSESIKVNSLHTRGHSAQRTPK
jgi:hypothetical protein